ncbi:CAAX protease [Corynebacterium sp. NML98-0116]|nr:CAAX protease [Corynebacterium sp. NML98-0116]
MKPATTVSEQIALLKQRGMQVNDMIAEQWLPIVGYYRLSGYWYPARIVNATSTARTDRFQPGVTFDDVIRLYEADRKLRTLVYDGMERIEIAMRALITDLLSLTPTNNPQVYLQSERFRQNFNHTEWLWTIYGRLNRASNRSASIKHYKNNYGGQFPLWIIAESMDFSDVSKLYSGLPSADQFKIAERLGISIDLGALNRNQKEKVFRKHPWANWLEQLTIIRNTCAHHGRLWNQSFLPASTVAMRTNHKFSLLPEEQSERIFGALVVMSSIIRVVSPGTTWPNKVLKLINTDFLSNPLVEGASIGMPPSQETLVL